MNKLHAMEVFCQIAECGSLTLASKELNKSLPTIVRTLATLEQYLQTRLLNRTTRRITLTDEGRVYLDDCRRIISEIENTENSLVDRKSYPSGKLKITSTVILGKMLVTPVINSFLAKHDKVSIELLLLDRVVNIIEEGIDIAIRVGELADSSMIATPVGKVRQVICASPDLLRQTGKIKTPKDLINKRCVLYHGFSQGPSWDFIYDGKKISIPIDDAFICNQVPSTIDACVYGIGFGKFLWYQVEKLVQEGKLEVILSSYEQSTTPVNIIYPSSRLMPPRVRVFKEYLAEHLRDSFGY